MSLILGFLFAGITFLNYWMGITPQHGETILSQMARGILGDSALGQVVYYLFQFSTALILAVAANTGFSAFPMLAYNMAKNKYMPHLLWKRRPPWLFKWYFDLGLRCYNPSAHFQRKYRTLDPSLYHWSFRTFCTFSNRNDSPLEKRKRLSFLEVSFCKYPRSHHLFRYRSYPTLLQTWRYLALLPNYPSLNLPLLVHPQSLPKSGQTASTL